MKLQRIDYVLRQKQEEAETFWQVFKEFIYMVIALLFIPWAFLYFGGLYVFGG